MSDAPVEIPQRPLFKASEVCEIAQLQPFVLRSWEKEFPDLGAAGPRGARVYRRADVERILLIKQLVFVEGLTLAGVRRRFEQESARPEDEMPALALVSDELRETLATVKAGLRGILQMLNGGRSASGSGPSGANGSPEEFVLTSADGGDDTPPRRMRPSSRQATHAG